MLTDGAPPNDRGCRACGKIGHLVADCPRKKAADQRKKQAKDRQRSMSEQPEGGKPGAQAQAGVEGGRNRTRSEIPPLGPAGNKEGSGELGAVSTDIRYKDSSQIKIKEKVPEKEKGDRERIKNLEKRRKRFGKLSKEENKVLYDLQKRVRESKRIEARKSDLDSSNDVNSSFEKAVRNVGVDVVRIETSRPIRNMKGLENGDVDDEVFDYNTVKSTVMKPGQIDYLNYSDNYLNDVKNNVKSEKNRKGFIDYTVPLASSTKTKKSSLDDSSLSQYNSASSEISTTESDHRESAIQKNKKKARSGRCSSIQDLKMTNKILLEKCTEISKQLNSELDDEDKSSESGSKLEKMQLKNQKRKENSKQKKKAKKEKQNRKASSSLSEFDSVQLDPDLLKIADNFSQLGLCRDAEMKYFSS